MCACVRACAGVCVCVCVYVVVVSRRRAFEVDIPSSNLDAAAAATDAALQRLPKESLPRRLAALIPVP